MPIEVLMPALSPTMKEGNLAKWLKKEGDKIRPGDVIAEIETDKATMEVEAVDEGILGKILIPANTRSVAVNSLIALILEDGEEAKELAGYEPKTLAINLPKQVDDSLKKEEPKTITQAVVFGNANRVRASPLAKRIASIERIDLTTISGTGPHGRIVKADLLNRPANKRGVVRNLQEHKAIPNSNIRRVIAQRLLESKQNIPHFYLSIECNIDKLLSLREDINADNEKYKISVNDFVIKAVALALNENPEANSSWTEEEILQYNNVDVSVAVAIEGGLITPIIKNADQKSLSEISEEMKLLAKKARENSLKPEEFQGGGFSISNLGMYGIKQFQAIINPPQSCIMAVGASSKRAVVIKEEIKMATMLDISLSCDHRVVDGVVGAKFLSSFKKYIESPIKMIL